MRSVFAVSFLSAFLAAGLAGAAQCPHNPDALGTSRVLVIDPLGNESDLVLERISDDARVQDDVFQLQLPPGVTVRDGSAAGG